MEVVNPFILKNKIGMIKFIDELCNIDFLDTSAFEETFTDSNNNRSNSSSYPIEETQDYAQDLAMVHNISESYRGELEQLASSSLSAKKLVTTLTILSQHKQYYTNLIRNAQQTVSTTLV